jgi:hypothetical protein
MGLLFNFSFWDFLICFDTYLLIILLFLFLVQVGEDGQGIIFIFKHNCKPLLKGNYASWEQIHFRVHRTTMAFFTLCAKHHCLTLPVHTCVSVHTCAYATCMYGVGLESYSDCNIGNNNGLFYIMMFSYYTVLKVFNYSISK